jgi:hypothetical protein
MQINLHFHPDAFESLEAAFDPARNTSYAGGYLKRLRDGTKSWRLAVARYHSATPQRGAFYRTKVYDFLRDERHISAQERRAAAKERYRRWRAEKAQLQHTPTRTYASAANSNAVRRTSGGATALPHRRLPPCN